MSESAMRRRVVSLLRPLDAISVENPVYPGTPDVNFADGWIELKHLHRWPASDMTTVRIMHFTAQQRVWLLRRWRAGGSAWMIVQVGMDWMLFDAETAALIIDRTCKPEMIDRARWHWHGLPDADELIHALKR